MLLENGTVKELVELLNSIHIDIIEQTIWCLGNIASDSVKVRDMLIDTGVIIPIANNLDKALPGSSFMRNVSWSLSNFCRGSPPP